MTFIKSNNTSSSHYRPIILYIFLSLCLVYILFQYYKLFFLPQSLIFRTDLIIKIPYHHRYLPSLNKSDNTLISLYYRHATTPRNSSYPYISGDTFRAFSDYIYDETREDKLTSVKYGDLVFVKTDKLPQFFSSPFNSIQKPFVLITHNSDISAPTKHGQYLLNPKILNWYASNPNVRNRSKLSPIPIGLSNTRWPQGNLDKITFALKKHRKPWSQRTSLLYVNFAIETNIVQRNKARSQASTIKNVQIIKKRITFETYLEHIGNAKFVLSPPGNGLDCHRTWEALLMGAVPIVLTSALDPLFLNTRSIVIDDWSKLTQEFLLSQNFSINDHLLPEVLYAHYWRDMLYKYRNS